MTRSLARATTIAAVAAGVMVVGSRVDISGAPDHQPAMGGIHWARGEAPAARPSKSPNLIYHGGTVMHGTIVEPIFWGTSWATDTSDKQTGLALFYNGIGGSSYATTNTEYTDGGGNASAVITLGNVHADPSAATANGQQTGPILAEVCKVVPNPQPNGYYPVYTDEPRGHARFCAWHSTGTCTTPTGSVQVQFAFFFKLDGDAGCDPQDPSTTHSQGLEALANVSGHELSETLTDNHLDAWYDANGAENADKCAWTFGTAHLTFTNQSQWKIQGNWSNAAYDSPTRGYPNSSGQKGCIDGGNYK
ncbi:MAG TPA: hypothetical protein VIW45_07690 [Vicinamibacterales bacterium]